MKKKLVIGLSVLLATCMLGACGTSDPKDVNINGVGYDEFLSDSENNLYLVAALYTMEQEGATAEELAEEYSDYITDYQLECVDSWATTVEECGEFLDLSTLTSFEDLEAALDVDNFKVTKAGKTVTSDMTVQFADRTATFEVVYTAYNMEISGLSVTTDYSFGEKMVKAALNTVISMSIVFLVLILIALIIYAFNIFPYLEKKKKEKAAARAAASAPAAASAASAAPAAAPAAPVVEEDLTDDTELVAVISAAIAASEGGSTTGFVVRSINRR